MTEIKLIVKEELLARAAAEAAEHEANRLLREGWELHSVQMSSTTYPSEKNIWPAEVWTTCTITLLRRIT